MKTFLKILAAAMVAVGMGVMAIAYDASDNLVIVTMFATAIAVAAVLGVFDVSAKGRHMTIKDGARSLEQAA